MQSFIGFVIATLLLAPMPAAAAGAGDAPRAIVDQITNTALKILGDQQLDTETKRHRIEDIVYAHVDFDTMSRLVLARNLSRFSEPQKTVFVNEFKEHLSLTYGKSIESYKNERVQITGDHEEARGDWTVNTKIVRGSGADDILVDYRLRKEGDVWRIIDIVIERVSLVANYRSQFQDIVSRGGPDRLLELLRDKNAKRESFES